MITATVDAYAQVTGSATITSDYVWRGSSQTREEPAVQAAFKYTHASGLYGSLWGSNDTFQPDVGARSEFDIAVGWSGDVASDWALD
ncbi:MAG: TorF family putative porin, partial [Pseudohongiella sp.]|nr:TorF family putative porin [Pseudohongiella sp.]